MNGNSPEGSDDFSGRSFERCEKHLQGAMYSMLNSRTWQDCWWLKSCTWDVLIARHHGTHCISWQVGRISTINMKWYCMIMVMLIPGCQSPQESSLSSKGFLWVPYILFICSVSFFGGFGTIGLWIAPARLQEQCNRSRCDTEPQIHKSSTFSLACWQRKKIGKIKRFSVVKLIPLLEGWGLFRG